MKLGIVLSNTEPETVFNVLRLGNYALSQSDTVRVFLLGKGVELDRIQDERFNVRQQAETLLGAGGSILACGTCLKLRDSQGPKFAPLDNERPVRNREGFRPDCYFP